MLAIFSPNDAMRIMAVAMLKIVHPGVCNGRLQQQYNRTFARCYYPGIALAKNTVCTFLKKLGQDSTKRHAFYQRRLETVEQSHHIAIDGTLKQDTSCVNSLSQFSRKARVKGCRDISILYAYDIEAMEPLCAHVYAGNIIDARAYRSFIVDNNITKGVILTDKGFPPKEIAEELKSRPALHFLTPIKRCDSRIRQFNMLSFEGIVTGLKKRVQAEESIIGEEFINFISTILTCRILRKADKGGVLDKMTYGEMMGHLEESARRIKGQRFDPMKRPSSTDDLWVNVTEETLAIMEALELSEPEPKPAPKKRSAMFGSGSQA